MLGEPLHLRVWVKLRSHIFRRLLNSCHVTQLRVCHYHRPSGAFTELITLTGSLTCGKQNVRCLLSVGHQWIPPMRLRETIG